MSLEEKLTQEELATNGHTWRHIWNLQRFMALGILTDKGFNLPSILHAVTRCTLNDSRDYVELDVFQSVFAEPTLRKLWNNTEAYVWYMSKHFTARGLTDAPNKLVQFIINDRLLTHDQSKLVAPELTTFVEFTPKLKTTKFGTPEYNQFLLDMKPALDNHYANNRHHPEHYPNGVDDMTLFDVYEMMCDWIVASLRTKDGSFVESVAYCSKRFTIDPALSSLFLTTYDALFVDEYAKDQGEYYSQKIGLHNT